ncbi:MAG: FHA domain-containing protein [Lachnospiraceae bacterium]|nr:FHA domain-containing protein [Lachnospiraceae bacterium]
MKKLEFNVSKQNNVDTIKYELSAADVYDDRAADKASQLANIIPFQYSDVDGKRSFTSYAHEDTTLSVMYKSTLSKKDVLCLMSGLCAAFEIGAQGIPVSYIVKDSDYIFINKETLAVKCIIVPIKQDVMPLAEIPAFFRTVVSNMRFSEADKDNYVAELITQINADDFSVSKLKGLIDGQLEKMGLFISKDNGLMNMTDNSEPKAAPKDVKVNKLGVMAANMQMNQPMMGQPQMAPQMNQPMMGQPGMMPQMNQPMGQPQMAPQAPRPMGQPGMMPQMNQPMGQPQMAPQAPKPMGQPGMMPQMNQPMGQPQMAPQAPKPMGQPGMMPQMNQPMGQPQMAPQAPKPMGQPGMMPQMNQPMGQPQMAPQAPKPMGQPGMMPQMNQPMGQPGMMPQMNQPMGQPQMAPQAPQPVGQPGMMPQMNQPMMGQPQMTPQYPTPVEEKSEEPVAEPAPEVKEEPVAEPVPEVKEEPVAEPAPEVKEEPVVAPTPAPMAPQPVAPAPAPVAPQPVAPTPAPVAPTPKTEEPPVTPRVEAPQPVTPPIMANSVKPVEDKPEEDKPATGTPVMMGGQNGLVGQLGTKPIPHIVRKKTGETINITKSEFSIGKSKTKADYAIEDNTAISRVHCIIVQKDGVNYIKDNGSTNHTYINGVELQPGKEVLLKNKTVIQMGDEEFTFLLRKGE